MRCNNAHLNDKSFLEHTYVFGCYNNKKISKRRLWVNFKDCLIGIIYDFEQKQEEIM